MKITKAITNCQLVLERGILWDATLLLSDNKIAAFGAARETEIPEGTEIIDANGKYVGPGFIDIHVHAGNGYSTYRQPVEAAKYFLSHGETSILATPSYDIDYEAHMNAIRTVKAAMKEAMEGKRKPRESDKFSVEKKHKNKTRQGSQIGSLPHLLSIYRTDRIPAPSAGYQLKRIFSPLRSHCSGQVFSIQSSGISSSSCKELRAKAVFKSSSAA